VKNNETNGTFNESIDNINQYGYAQAQESAPNHQNAK
jgi:hypothetical protein